MIGQEEHSRGARGDALEKCGGSLILILRRESWPLDKQSSSYSEGDKLG